MSAQRLYKAIFSRNGLIWKFPRWIHFCSRPDGFYTRLLLSCPLIQQLFCALALCALHNLLWFHWWFSWSYDEWIYIDRPRLASCSWLISCFVSFKSAPSTFPLPTPVALATSLFIAVCNSLPEVPSLVNSS